MNKVQARPTDVFNIIIESNILQRNYFLNFQFLFDVGLHKKTIIEKKSYCVKFVRILIVNKTELESCKLSLTL